VRRRDLVTALMASLCGGPSIALARQAEAYDRANLVSMIRLIANPNSFDGRRVRLEGYLEHNGIDRAVGLYVSEVDGRNHVISNSIDLHRQSSTTMREFMGKYVLLNATFHAPKGPMAEFLNGYLDNISGLKEVPRPE